MSGPHDPYDWWFRRWLPLQPKAPQCQKGTKNVQDAAQVHKETSQEIRDKVPESRHSARNISMLMQAFIKHLERSARVILF